MILYYLITYIIIYPLTSHTSKPTHPSLLRPKTPRQSPIPHQPETHSPTQTHHLKTPIPPLFLFFSFPLQPTETEALTLNPRPLIMQHLNPAPASANELLNLKRYKDIPLNLDQLIQLLLPHI